MIILLMEGGCRGKYTRAGLSSLICGGFIVLVNVEGWDYRLHYVWWRGCLARWMGMGLAFIRILLFSYLRKEVGLS